MHKQGGFPPIKYCSDKKDKTNTTGGKERFFSVVPRQNINIRQLLSDNKKIPIIITDNNVEENIEIADTL